MIMCPLFSIIIPHKEIPDLLMRCLKSIPITRDIQVIVVDDNSADADTYLERYPELSRPYLEFIRTTKGMWLWSMLKEGGFCLLMQMIFLLMTLMKSSVPM